MPLTSPSLSQHHGSLAYPSRGQARRSPNGPAGRSLRPHPELHRYLHSFHPVLAVAHRLNLGLHGRVGLALSCVGHLVVVISGEYFARSLHFVDLSGFRPTSTITQTLSVPSIHCTHCYGECVPTYTHIATQHRATSNQNIDCHDSRTVSCGRRSALQWSIIEGHTWSRTVTSLGTRIEVLNAS